MPSRRYENVNQNLQTTRALIGKIRDLIMYAKVFHKAAHVRRLTVRAGDTQGWQVLDEQDSTVIKSVTYKDWHRVERAMALFAAEASLLTATGWIEG